MQVNPVALWNFFFLQPHICSRLIIPYTETASNRFCSEFWTITTEHQRSLHFPLQVHLQTQQEVRTRFLGMAVQVVRTNGVLALYSGLTASLSRQVHYLASFPGHSAQCTLDLIPRLYHTVSTGTGPGLEPGNEASKFVIVQQDSFRSRHELACMNSAVCLISLTITWS